jgi:RNA polymerase sigma-70 factor, ECF subfamily
LPGALSLMERISPAPRVDRRAENPGAERARSSPQSRLELFEEIMLPHLNAAYNMARWLTRDEDDAGDVLQEAYLRAFRFFDNFHDGDGKAWLLAVVRNAYRSWRRRQFRVSHAVPFDETVHSVEDRCPDQEQRVADGEKFDVIRACMEMLPVESREVLVLRELEEMSYREIAAVTGLAIGTIMSRLSRARQRLEQCVARRTRGTIR